MKYDNILFKRKILIVLLFLLTVISGYVAMTMISDLEYTVHADDSTKYTIEIPAFKGNADYYYKYEYSFIMNDSSYKPFIYGRTAGYWDTIKDGGQYGFPIGFAKLGTSDDGEPVIENLYTVAALLPSSIDVHVEWKQYRSGKKDTDADYTLFQTSTINLNNSNSILITKDLRGSVPFFKLLKTAYDNFDDAAKQALADYYVDGNTDGLIFAPKDSYPEFGGDNVEESNTLGLLYNVRAVNTETYIVHQGGLVDGSESSEYPPGTFLSWSVSGDAVSPPVTLPATPEDYASYRVEVRMSFLWWKNYLLKDDNTFRSGALKVYSDFEQYPSLFSYRELISKQKASQISADFSSSSESDNDILNTGKCRPEFLYLRIVKYDKESRKYLASSQWTRVEIIGDDGEAYRVEQGTFGTDGSWLPDPSGMSYDLDDSGVMVKGDNVPDDMLNKDDLSFMLNNGGGGTGWSVVQSFINDMQDLPQLIYAIFLFLPKGVIWAMGAVLLAIIVRRVLFG